MFKTIAVGGTFDLLHKGHREFIKRAFEKGEKVVIGLTSDEYAQCKIQNSNDKSNPKSKIKINTFYERKRELMEFLEENNWLERVDIVKIHDVYGEADKNSYIQAIMVSKDTSRGARLINEKRKDLGLSPLDIIHAPMIRADDRGMISSARIRLGEIDREGKLYRQLPLWGEIISPQLREKLKNPIGLLLMPNEYKKHEIPWAILDIIKRIEPPLIFTVGDEVTKFCNQYNIRKDIAIIDFRVKRQLKYKSLNDLKFERYEQRRREEVVNKAGVISKKMMKAVARAINKVLKMGKSRIVKVRGEEDLAAVPAVLLAPLDSLVLYGQPDAGVVAIVTSEEKKKQIVAMFEEVISH